MTSKGSTTSGESDQPWPRYRSHHRRRSHDDAHADAQAHDSQPLLQDPLVCAGEASLVTSEAEFHQLLEKLRAARRFAYDSEFIGEESYFPELCLVQVATTDLVALIDPMQNIDLQPFWRLLADADIEVIVHAGQPDLEPVVRHLGQMPRNIFDTQVASAFAGLPYPMSLGKLLKELTGFELAVASRNLKFSQWNRRPLTASQIRYAADDVRYLPLIHQRLRERLTDVGNLGLAHEECATVAAMNLPAGTQSDTPAAAPPSAQRVRVRGVERLSRRKQFVLRRLLQWRDQVARKLNIPPRSLLRDDVLFSLATSPVKTADDLDRVAGLPRPVEQRYGEEIIAITREALEARIDPALVPTRRRTLAPFDRDQHRAQVEALWKQIEQRCNDRTINPAIVTSRRELDQYLARRRTNSSLSDHRLHQGWRGELLREVLATASAPEQNPNA